MQNGQVSHAGAGFGLPWKRLIAEVIAITAGVYLGLLADDYRDYRKDRVSEQEFLRILIEDLNRDHEILVALRRVIEIQSNGAQLINGYPDSFDISVEAAEAALTGLIIINTYDPQRTTYLGLRDSAQLQLITSPSLRSLLMSYFEVLQPLLLVSVSEFVQAQETMKARLGRHVRMFPPERFDTLRRSPNDPSIIKLLVPISQIQEDVELMNAITEVGARGFGIVELIDRAEEQNRDLLDTLSEQTN